MGKAYLAPKAHKPFHFHVQDHAIRRFRERAAEDTHRHRGNEDLARLLDERIGIALDSGHYFDVDDDDAPLGALTRVAIVEDQLGRVFHVILRPYDSIFRRPGKAPFGPIGPNAAQALTACTVWTEEMGKQRLANGKWRVRSASPKQPTGVVAAKPFATALQAVTPMPTMKRKRGHSLTGATMAQWPEGWRTKEAKEAKRRWCREYFAKHPDAMPIDVWNECRRVHGGVSATLPWIRRLKREMREERIVARAVADAAADPIADVRSRFDDHDDHAADFIGDTDHPLDHTIDDAPPLPDLRVVQPATDQPVSEDVAPAPVAMSRTAEISIAFAQAAVDERVARDRVFALATELAAARVTMETAHARAVAAMDELLAMAMAPVAPC